MGDHVVLIGADDVRSAGNAMRSAAEQIQSAASSISFALEQHQRFMDEWLGRLADILAAAFPAAPPETPGDPQTPTKGTP